MPEQETVDETPTTPAATPDDYEAWLKGQPESVQALVAKHTGGLKSALDAERAESKEAAKLRKRLEQFEKAEQDRKEAEMSEMDKLKAKTERLEAELAERNLSELKRTIAAEVGLPDSLAARLQGKDEAALRADAEQLKAALPAQDEPERPKPKPKITPTNPGSGQAAGETAAQKRNRIYGGGGDIFDPTLAAQHGGGVAFNSDLE